MTSGHPFGDDLAAELAPLLAEDHSIWSYDADVGGFTCPPDHPDVVCRDAAAVASHVNGPERIVRQWHGKEHQ